MHKSTNTAATTRRKSRQCKPARKPSASSLNPRSCSIPDSTPRFKSFAHVRSSKVRRALEFEQHLLFMCDMFPEYKTGIEEQIAYARSQQERGRTSDRARVIKQLEPCELTCREVSDDLRIPYATAYKILQELAESGIVIIREREGRAGNKPVCYYSLSHARKL